jgi:hypothetical protein
MDKFIRRIVDAFLQGVEDVMAALCEGMSAPEAEMMIKERCDSLAVVMYSEYLEEVDRQVRKDLEGRKGWVVNRRRDSRSILSIMGNVEYERTYYHNEGIGEYRHLSDDMCGITPHARITPLFRVNLVENSCEMSYGKAGELTGRCAVSDQTVMNSLRKLRLDLPTSDDGSPAKEKRKVKRLYVEADEDHLSGNRNKRRRLEPKLVYVHEGRKRIGRGRTVLVHAKYFGGMYKDPERLWWEVYWYIERTYDIDSIEIIFVTGDGANWITFGAEFMMNGVRLPDLFHLRKYIVAACHGDKELMGKLWKAVDSAERSKTFEILDAAGSTTVTKGQAKSVERCRTYISNMWGAIENRRRYYQEAVGCSAEGHVSHIYSDRMSSRPMSWSEEGANIMAKLRVKKANGESVSACALPSTAPQFESIQIDQDKAQQLCSEVKAMVRTSGRYLCNQLGNVPVLKGNASFTARVFRELRDSIAI